MLFSSLTFLLAFLPLTLFLYYINKNRDYRNLILLISSIIFYSWGEPKTILLMFLSIIINYFIALEIEKEKNKKLLLLISIIFNIGTLFYFKYFNFFIKDILLIKDSTINIVLPIGISFYTFQILSYVIDVYRKTVKAQKNILYLGAYISMFPQLIAGPIVRYETIEKELVNREENITNFSNGLRRFIIGLSKKIIIANQMAIISDKIFINTPIENINSMYAWLGAIAFTFQIYFDFSGYSDMAIGLGKMFGFDFMENFNYPYIAKNITDFWRRWHISLSSWFKDYVYIPLGGSRINKLRSIINILIIWTLTGLWHGASYNFIVWGLYFGIILIIEKNILKNFTNNFIYRIITILLIIIGWVIFNSSSFTQIYIFIKNIFILNGKASITMLNNDGILYLLPYMIIAFIASFPLFNNILKKLNKNLIGSIIVDSYIFILLVICLIFLVNNSYNPFIYFRF